MTEAEMEDLRRLLEIMRTCGRSPVERDALGNVRCRRCRYREYLRSSAWERRRDREVKRAGRQCERCGRKANRTAKGNWAGLNVHHLSYDNLGDEQPGDLIVLCRQCHEQEHGITS